MKPITNSLYVRDVTQIGLMVALIEVCKLTLAFLPNIELTTFWIIMFTLYFGRKIYFVIPVFIFIEGLIYGFGLWWIMYLFVWPLLAFLTRLLQKHSSVLTWSILAGCFGLAFGLLCAVPYFFLATTGTLAIRFQVTFAWWIAGIPWDIVHGISNFILMSQLYRPLKNVIERIKGSSLTD